MEEFVMYVGRIVAVGRTIEDKLVVMYRVSSRSFPNRQANIVGKMVSIVPKEGYETDIFSNPYISYNCLRVSGPYAVVSNGSHTDPIAEKLSAGMNMRDALISALSGLDYEHDDYKTPRIAAVIDSKSRRGALGIIRSDALLVEETDLSKGGMNYLATYEHNHPDKQFGEAGFHVKTSEEACDYILRQGLFARLERPIVAACAMEDVEEYSIFVKEALRQS
jgi:IMP cyclohydrolase